MHNLLQRLKALRRFDLAQPWRLGMPHWPTHPPYTHSLTKLHGDIVLAGGASSAADAISLGTHTGTHIDAPAHFSRHGRLHGGADVAAVQDYALGIAGHGVDRLGLMLTRCILLDAAADGPLAPETGLGAKALAQAERAAGVRIEAGDAVLIRTGWGARWNAPAAFVNARRQPGVTLDGAAWLSARGVALAGSDTVAFERTPSAEMAVHVHLLVEHGIPIVECLNLEELAAAHAYESLLVLSPLRLEGATASPCRPYALVE
jgi:kynurenine formamidase